VNETATVTLVNKRGLHARASNKFMECVLRFNAEVLVRSHNDVCAETVVADSVMELPSWSLLNPALVNPNEDSMGNLYSASFNGLRDERRLYAQKPISARPLGERLL